MARRATMNTFYDEVANCFQDHLRDDVIDAMEAACVTSQEWASDRGQCIQRITSALEEFAFDDFDDHQPSEYQEWYDFDPDC
jgi:hypothetical protein